MDGAGWAPLNGTVIVAADLDFGDSSCIKFRINLSGHASLPNGMAEQTVRYLATCDAP